MDDSQLQQTLITYYNDKDDKQFKVIEKHFEVLPGLMENIKNSILQAFRVAFYGDKSAYLFAMKNAIRLPHGPIPYFVKRPSLIPFHVVCNAALIQYQDICLENNSDDSEDNLDDDHYFDNNYCDIDDCTQGYKRRKYLALCGLPQHIDQQRYDDRIMMCYRDDDEFFATWGGSLIRAYFAARSIQRLWRAYKIKKESAKKIQRVWRKQIASPYTRVGQSRLMHEFNEMIIC